ncbi:hypothetical protein BAUCODRAFT_399494 [Baudoinia panamericana UAMH 10762]|uniref:Uncharacterized protein n=1 Tax=Baudoinia panamericana (strain UAMH 10762) TaxID=717646 RepID=M2N5M0_BAUPA|nr:uncharacterized protein BAUCODRAFT_399494 [Baudoinia panamericana UAMH 10762]EMC99328.1 hypothetical protein BAUCODRAFT_399494 [Baudoinia panamericana UAMH 10762]
MTALEFTIRLKAGWTAYQALHQEQQSWRHATESRVFQAAFALLPNVEQAALKCAVPFEGRTNLWPVWKTLRRETLVGPDDWMFTHAAHDSLIDTPESDYKHGGAALCLLQAIGYRGQFSGTHHITELEMHITHKRAYRQILSDSLVPDPRATLHIIDAAFLHLTKLRLVRPHAADSELVSDGTAALETKDQLLFARNLKRLDLTFNDATTVSADRTGTIAPLHHIFNVLGGGPYWSGLAQLNLSTNVEPKAFIAFLNSHADTLKYLELRDMAVNDVPAVLTAIPAILALKRVYLECVWHWNEETDSMTCLFEQGSDVSAEFERSTRAWLLREQNLRPDFEANLFHEDAAGDDGQTTGGVVDDD